MYVSPEISEKEARQILSCGISFLPVKMHKKSLPPRRIEMIYLPFYMFEILLKGEAEKQKVTVSLDGLVGSALFFARKNLDYKSKIDNPVCHFVLSQKEAQEMAVEEYKWLLLEHGLRTRKISTVEEITEVRKIFYPFWVGYFQRGKAYDFKTIDGVSGEIQGVKMRKVFLKAFRQMSEV